MSAQYNPQGWHTFIRINNSTLLRMYLYDGHLRDGIAVGGKMESELDSTIVEYCRNEAGGDVDSAICKFGQLFTHSALGIDEVMEEYIAHERQVTDELHRGHIKHSLGCVLLAHFLLEFDANCLLQVRPEPVTREAYPEGEVIHKHLPERNYPYKAYFLDPFLWLLFFHDWGYLYQVPTWRQKHSPDLAEVTELRNVLEGSFMAKNRKEGIDSLWNLMESEYTKNMDHGVASSLMLLRKLGELPEIPSKDEEELFRELNQDRLMVQRLKKQYYYEALSAIAMHNLPLGRQRYGFKICDNVYYFLLKLVDEIVDWSRPVKTKFWRPIEPLDHILLNVQPQPNQQSRMLLQTIVNFRDNEHLFEAAEKIEDFDEGGKLFEVNKLEEKAEVLKVLDLKEPGTNQRWLHFEMILIDRNGRVHHLCWDDDIPVVVSEDTQQPVYQP